MKSHRTWFKVILNPFLRKFGWSIVSIIDDNKVIGYDIRKYPQHCKLIKSNLDGN
jgi:hypothetical protein